MDDFYTIWETKPVEKNSFQSTLTIHKDHDIFKGHFPKYPVAPGVVLLQIIKNLLEAHLQQSLFLQASSNIKFLSLVNPMEQITLLFTIEYTIDNKMVNTKNLTTFQDGSKVLKCNATFVKQ
ncbi:MAG TPA: hypothetical protein VKZ98_09670 [Aquaticitalea sp.]|nr:hypothetical protein [Aquaticitalea sp.]